MVEPQFPTTGEYRLCPKEFTSYLVITISLHVLTQIYHTEFWHFNPSALKAHLSFAAAVPVTVVVLSVSIGSVMVTTGGCVVSSSISLVVGELIVIE